MPLPSNRPNPVRALAAALLALALGGRATLAQSPESRVAQVGRIAVEDAPRIDGDLDDACWRNAPAIGELVMVEPFEGNAPDQRTVVKLLHDRHAFYLALWCFDDDPAAIRATQRARDARLDPDDRVEILIDPFENRRTGFFFQIGAGGSIGDILISGNGERFDKPWDAVWSGVARVTAEGWLAEIAIPFRSIPRRDGATRWGFNLKRLLRARNEEYQWANPLQAISFYKPSQCGTIEGFGEIDGGHGVELVPYVKVGADRDRRDVDPAWGSDLDAGGELYWRPLPSATLALTAFTDFAETEDDSRQINLDRFPLFFPEKRDFFLDGASYFSFGARNAGGTTFLPFFTRRIGLAADGTQIPLLGGVKLNGEFGATEVGLLDVQTDRVGGYDRENLAVARLKQAVADRTTVGLIATHGDPTGVGSDTVAGVDLWHREPRLVGDLDLELTVDALVSAGSGAPRDGESFGVSATSRGREWEVGAGVRWVSADFTPSLGFVRRRDSRSSHLEVGWSPRIAGSRTFRSLLFGVDLLRSERWNGAPQAVDYELRPLGISLHSGDYARLFVRRGFERVDADFRLFRDTTPVPAGDYRTTRTGLELLTSEGRPWNCNLTASTGELFDGRSDSVAWDGEWRTSPLLHLGAGYQTDRVDLGPGRAFTTQIALGRLDLFFSPAVSLRNLVQFDNESRVLGWQSRLRWIYAPGCDLFAVLGTTWLREDDGSLAPQEQALELKIAQSIRF